MNAEPFRVHVVRVQIVHAAADPRRQANAAAPEGAAHPPGLAYAGSRQDVRSAVMAPGGRFRSPRSWAPFRIRPDMLPRSAPPGERSSPGGCCRSSRPLHALEAARTCAARPGYTVRSYRSPRSETPTPDQTGHAAADPRRQANAAAPGGCCSSSPALPTLEAARTCAARPGHPARSCRNPRSWAPAQDQTGHAAADPRRSPLPVPAAASIRGPRRARSSPGGCCPSSRPRPTLEAARTCAARPGRAVRNCRSPRSRAPLPILTPLLRKSEHPARGTRRATGARKAPDVLLYSLPRQNVTHTPELSRVVFCLLFAP